MDFATGSVPALQYSTYLSGNGSEIASGLAIDHQGRRLCHGNHDFEQCGYRVSVDLISFGVSADVVGCDPVFCDGSVYENRGSNSIFYSTYFGGS